MKFGTAAKIRVEITKMMVSTPQNEQTDRQTAPPVKIESCQITMKFRTVAKIREEITKMMVPTPQSKQTSRQTAPPHKIKSHRIKVVHREKNSENQFFKSTFF